jgi:hypothetical protein
MGPVKVTIVLPIDDSQLFQNKCSFVYFYYIFCSKFLTTISLTTIIIQTLTMQNIRNNSDQNTTEINYQRLPNFTPHNLKLVRPGEVFVYLKLIFVPSLHNVQKVLKITYSVQK